jgi:HEAT repeat protein
MKRMPVAGAWVIAWILIGDATTTVPGAQSPTRLPPPAAAVDAWFNCVECTAAQLAAVAALGDAAVPELSQALRVGPPQTKIDAQRSFLETRWQKMQAYAATHPGQPLTETQSQYVDGYLQQFVLTHRARAARGLGAINTQAARNALTQALQLPNLPDALRKEITDALVRP